MFSSDILISLFVISKNKFQKFFLKDRFQLRRLIFFKKYIIYIALKSRLPYSFAITFIFLSNYFPNTKTFFYSEFLYKKTVYILSNKISI